MPRPHPLAATAAPAPGRSSGSAPPRALLLCAAALASPALHAQAELLADIHLGNGPAAGSEPGQFLSVGAGTVFRACSREFGCELWVSTLNHPQAVPLTDICPGPCDSDPGDLAYLSSFLLFSADDGQHGRELWSIGPPDFVPRMVPEALVGPEGTDPRRLSHSPLPGAGNAGFASIAMPDGRRAIARLGGLDSEPRWQGSIGPFTQVGDLVAQGDRVIFSAVRDDPVALGAELWRADITEFSLSSALLRDIRPGSAGSAIAGMVAVPQRGGVFFRANDGSTGLEPWYSDGTTAGTRRLADIAPGSAGSAPVEPLAFANGSVFFFADDLGNGGNRDLWAVDGAGLVARKVANFDNGLARGLRALGGGMAFTASNGVDGREFWASGGLPQNTFQVTDLIPGSAGLSYFASAVSGNFYYLAGGAQLYRTDATAAGTRQVGVNTGTGLITSVHGGLERVLFPMFQAGLGDEPHLSAVAMPGQIDLLSNIAEDVGHSQGRTFFAARPGVFELDHGTVLFAFDDEEGLELRRLDGGGQASVLAPTQAGPASLLLESQLDDGRTVQRDGRLYFVDDQASVWASDGSAAGTRRLERFGDAPFQAASVDCLLPRGNGDVLALIDPGGAGSIELWRIDGSGGPSQPLLTADLLPANASLGDSAGGCPVEFGNLLLLRAYLPETGFELFRSNLSPGHLVLVRDLAPGSASGFDNRIEPAVAGGKFYFGATGIGGGLAPWVSDGTAQGTVQLLDGVSPPGAQPHSFTAYGSDMLFVARDALARHHLWRSDGSVAGTRTLTGVAGPGIALRLPVEETGAAGRALAVDGERIFFIANGAVQGSGSWLHVSLGEVGDQRRLSPAGLVEPLAPQRLTVVPGAGVVFGGYQPDSGRELWFSDGTDAGTVAVADVAAGTGHGGPHGISVLSDGVYFSADDGARGREPWRVPVPRADAIFASGFQSP